MSNIKKYKTWFDTRTERLVTYSPHWKKEDWKCLLFVGELQPNQQPFTLKVLRHWRVIIGRVLWGKFNPLFSYIRSEERLIPFKQNKKIKEMKP